MEGPARELRERAVGKTLIEVRTTPEGWVGLVFDYGGAMANSGDEGQDRVEWWVTLESARSIK